MQQIQCTHRVLPKNRRFEKILFELMVLFRTVVNRSSTFIINNTREDVNRKMKNYYVGIDMGTNSVGWAATDCEYHLLKARGQDLWGSYLFDEAEGAQKRRSFRTARRRTARTRQRLLLLQSLFQEEMAKKDPLFFIRLNNSPLVLKDKNESLKTSDSLFADQSFTDKNYFKKYPTIYHLRASLINDKVTDVRLLYLAVHHIIKNRGHFLFESQNFNVANEEVVKDKFFAINAFLSDREMPTLNLERLHEVLQVLKQTKTSKRDKQKTLGELLGVSKEKPLTSIVKALIGGTVSLKDLYSAESDFDDIKSFCFDKASFEDLDLPAIKSAVGEDDAELVLLLKSVYDWTVLCGIMGDEEYISFAKVKIYNKHKSDLVWLKNYVRQNFSKETYNEVFRRKDKKNNYAAYIGMDKQKGFSKCKQEDFYAFLKKRLNITDETVLAEMDKGQFLPKQVIKTNGVVPYQLHLLELKAILRNAQKYFSFLSEKQEGVTVAEKIVSLMTFRIPYYVGPLNTASKKYAWAVRRPGYENVSITPWNFHQIVDSDASEEQFIRRMTNKCTYLVGQDVLPANSLLYSEYVFLNELNNLRINGEKNNKARQLIFHYAKQHKRVTLKNCLALLVRNGLLPADSSTDVFSGLDGDFKTSLSTWYDFRFLGDRLQTQREMCEQIILWITLISDKNRLEKRIRTAYGQYLSDEEIKRIKGFNYSKWGRLSKILLDGIVSERCFDENGELLTIIEAMRQKGENFMQLLSDKYGFQDAIERYNQENSPSDDKVSYQTVEDLYCSPSVKRAIWRTVEIVREIVKIQGCAPQKLFLETARETKDNGKAGKRTVSRKQQLLDLYKDIHLQQHDWIKEIESLPDSKFNSDRLVLYYRQLGRSMYSGKPIKLEEVFDRNICDIDHIYPQSKIKDDSLDNRVLVYKDENSVKSDKYPISSEVRNAMRPFWQSLWVQGLISERKYQRLIRSTPLTVDELADFINRQLVITRQSTKATAQILKQMLPDTEIVYTKAANANEFKDKNNLLKVRELNDLHHAKDAYINIVVGNVYNTKFNHNAAVFFRNNSIDSYNFNKLYESDIPGAWRVAQKADVLATFQKNTCKVVRMTVNGHGALFDVNPVVAGKNADLVPLKKHGAIADTSRYGGYNSAKTAYFVLVRSDGKAGKQLLSLEQWPLWMEKQTGGSTEAKLNYFSQKLTNPQICIDRIKQNTLLCVNGSYAWLKGKTGNAISLCNANQLFLDGENVQTLKLISNYMRDRKTFNNPQMPANEKITAENNLRLYDALVQKLSSSLYAGLAICGQVPFLKEKRPVFASLSVEKQCCVLWEVLRLMQCNVGLSDFTLLGGVANAGVTTINKFIQDKNIKLIFQSPTGYYRTVVDVGRFLK